MVTPVAVCLLCGKDSVKDCVGSTWTTHFHALCYLILLILWHSHLIYAGIWINTQRTSPKARQPRSGSPMIWASDMGLRYDPLMMNVCSGDLNTVWGLDHSSHRRVLMTEDPADSAISTMQWQSVKTHDSDSPEVFSWSVVTLLTKCIHHFPVPSKWGLASHYSHDSNGIVPPGPA